MLSRLYSTLFKWWVEHHVDVSLSSTSIYWWAEEPAVRSGTCVGDQHEEEKACFLLPLYGKDQSICLARSVFMPRGNLSHTANRKLSIQNIILMQRLRKCYTDWHSCLMFNQLQLPDDACHHENRQCSSLRSDIFESFKHSLMTASIIYTSHCVAH